MSTTSKIVWGIAGVVAAGVVIGLLIAPGKGKDLRKQIDETTSDLPEKGKNLIEKGKKAAKEKFA